MADIVTRRYASALYKLYQEEAAALEKAPSEVLDEAYDEVKHLHHMVIGLPDWLALMKHPDISTNEKLKMLEDAFKGKISENLLGFFAVVLSKGHGDLVAALLRRFMELVDESRRVVVAYVTSPVPLLPTQVSAIQLSLAKSLEKRVKVETAVDPSLLGGVHIVADGKAFDNTVKRRLAELKTNILNAQLA